jgi:putative ABC transport system permease protein
MKRKLIKQMCNEWRDNIWLILELVVVSVAMVVVMMNVVCNIELKTRPMGIGPVDDIYVASYSELNEESPGYVDYGERKAEFISRDIRRVTAALRRNQYVEKAGLVQNGIPFTLNYIGNYREFVVNGDSLRYFFNMRQMSPEAAEILGLEGSSGFSAADVKAALERGEVVISDYVFGEEEKPYDVRRLVGQNYVSETEDGVTVRRIGAISSFMRRFQYEPHRNGMMILPVNEGAGGNLAIYSNLVIKVRPGTGKRFLESLQSQPTLASGNVFLKTPVNLEAKRKDVSAKHDTRFNLFVACMFFLLMIIFLGILGTFWFRIRQREGEIALRRVTGATRGDIFRRILSESMLLLVIATIPAILLDVLLLYRNMSLMNGSRLSIQEVFWISGALTFLVMTLSILLGAWFPASRAMRIHPAEALKEE